jgi:hypothetical protein
MEILALGDLTRDISPTDEIRETWCISQQYRLRTISTLIMIKGLG